METKKLCCGIDVSFTTLDVCYQNNLGELYHLRVGNNNEGFAKIMAYTGPQYHFVMEATGVYYVRLAFFLHQKACELSVVNALAVKRFIQMHGERNKSDKKDAAWICRYAVEQRPAAWQMPKAVLTFRANSSTTLSANTKSKSNGSTTSCTALVCCLFKAKTPSDQLKK